MKAGNVVVRELTNMVMSWELAAQNRVLVGILHVETVATAWAVGFRNLQIPGHVCFISGQPFDMARNVVCMRALDIGAEYVFFLDSDVIPPPDAIHRLMSHNLPIVSGVYHRRSPPHGVAVALRHDGSWVTDYPPNTLMEVAVAGAGCLLLKTEMLSKLPPLDPNRGKHWFDWRADMKGIVKPERGDIQAISEDFAFNLWALRHGIKTYLDTGVQCKHIGLAEAGNQTFLPLGPP